MAIQDGGCLIVTSTHQLIFQCADILNAFLLKSVQAFNKNNNKRNEVEKMLH